MAYSTIQQVKARAGALSGSWSDSSVPGNSDLEQFIDDVAAEIDALLGALGLASPAAGTPANAALAGVNADGALLIALPATFPEGSGPSSASKVIDGVRARYEESLGRLEDGSHPAIRLLEAGNVTSRASSFWENEPLYGIFPFDPRLDPLAPDANPNTAPTVARGQSL